ncbi:tyrosine-type recombinase/integrase [Marivivens sp. LCG002]|uniref:tyrosine-type recombinase/integrase n=1 Tax=Marivivens sp. LCG002 TaxID=3051171 RepID=UPI002557B98D|nr:site-specific integrase [Marivivens sp. LCG002]WIV52055.1 tyrosine-type recombinase/integrase [Marivivens sp. LCG002]
MSFVEGKAKSSTSNISEKTIKRDGLPDKVPASMRQIWLSLQCRLEECPFNRQEEINLLVPRTYPYFYGLMTGYHIGVYRPDERTCTWIARYLDANKKYHQHALGPVSLRSHQGITLEQAIISALIWFNDPKVPAQASHARVRGRIKEIGYCPLPNSVPTIGSVLRDYFEWCQLSRTPKGYYNALVLMNYHVIPNFGSIAIEELTAEHIVLLARQVVNTPARFGFMPHHINDMHSDLNPDELRKRKRTYNVVIGLLRSALTYAYENGTISDERKIRLLRRVPVIRFTQVQFLNQSQISALLEFSPPALQTLIKAALYTGCRVGELARIKVKDIGKGGFGIRIGAFKLGHGRFVFLPEEGMEFFNGLCKGKSADDLVLLSANTKQWRRQHSKQFNVARARAGLDSTFVFHGLRHTYASHMLMNGLSIEVLSRQLGHRSILTTFESYGHIADRYREQAVRDHFSSYGFETNIEELQGQNWLAPQLSELELGQHTRPAAHWAKYPEALLNAFGDT